MPAPVAVAAPAPVAAPAANGVRPVTPPPTAPAVVDEPLFEVKVGGEVRKFKKSEAEKLLSKAGFADQAIRQAKEALKATQTKEAEREALKSRIKTDKAARDAWLREHGIEPDDYARERLTDKLRDAEMTPEQRAIAERDAKIAELEQARKASEDERAEQQLSARAQHVQKHVESTLGDAWERAGFEKGADSFMAVYKTMAEWNELGLLPRGEEFTPAFADRIIEAARESIEGAFKSLESAALKGLKGKALYERIPKAVRDELNRYQLELIRGGGLKSSSGGIAPAAKPVDAPATLTTAEAWKKIRGGG